MPVKGGYEASIEILKLQKEARKRQRLLDRIEQLQIANKDFELIEKLEKMVHL